MFFIKHLILYTYVTHFSKLGGIDVLSDLLQFQFRIFLLRHLVIGDMVLHILNDWHFSFQVILQRMYGLN